MLGRAVPLSLNPFGGLDLTLESHPPILSVCLNKVYSVFPSPVQCSYPRIIPFSIQSGSSVV